MSLGGGGDNERVRGTKLGLPDLVRIYRFATIQEFSLPEVEKKEGIYAPPPPVSLGEKAMRGGGLED